ncbi:MAG: patatin-like phospholipase family protein [Spirulinaceae cyanobacterium]
MSFKRKLLSIDGGGIRGIIPAKILVEIEKRTQKSIFELFDLIAGTSTGGILALGLTAPDQKENGKPRYTAEDLLNLYHQESKNIFYEPFLERMTSADDLVRPKYSSAGRDEVLNQYFGKTPIKEALTEVLVPSYDIEQRLPVFFTSDPGKQETRSPLFRKIRDGFTMKQAAMATSAAPTYFKPYRVPTTQTRSGFYTLVDGGVFANNPTALATIEAITDLKQNSHHLNINSILVVSLGTGSLTGEYAYEQAENWGLLGWVRPLLNITLDGSSESVAVQMAQLLPPVYEQPQQYYRFQQFLGSSNDDLDDISNDNIQKLEALAEQTIAEKTEEIDCLCQQLCEIN